MNLSISSHVAPIATPHPPASKAAKAATDFEAVLLATLLDSLQRSFTGPMAGPTDGNSDYGFMSTQALASAMAARGGIGIARLILGQLTRHESTQDSYPAVRAAP